MQTKAPQAVPVASMVEDIVGCKWSLAVMQQIRGGVQRPGELERVIEGLSKKVLNERLRKLMRFGIIDKHSFAEIPPRVEYQITEFGQQFGVLLDDIEQLQRRLDFQKSGD